MVETQQFGEEIDVPRFSLRKPILTLLQLILRIRTGTYVGKIIHAQRWGTTEERRQNVENVASFDHTAYEDVIVMAIIFKALGIEGPFVLGTQHEGVIRDRKRLVWFSRLIGFYMMSLHIDSDNPNVNASNIRRIIDRVKGGMKSALLPTGNRLGEYSPLVNGYQTLTACTGKPLFPLIHEPIKGWLSTRWEDMSQDQFVAFMDRVDRVIESGRGVTVNLLEPSIYRRGRENREHQRDADEKKREQGRLELDEYRRHRKSQSTESRAA